MFYTVVGGKHYQSIGYATSDDLFNWTTAEDNIVIDCINFDWAAAHTNSYTNCRDPYITNYDGTWYCYYTALLKNGDGCIGVCVSNDLITWHDKGYCLQRPYNEGPGTEVCESPCSFRKDGLYYIVYNQGLGLKYAVSDNPISFSASPIQVLNTGELPNHVPYNFELLDADTGLFGYLCGGYYSYAAYGFCDIGQGKLQIRKIDYLRSC